PQGYDNWPMLVILVALAFMMLSSARRRADGKAGDKEEDELILASAGQRLMAGLIDGVPIVLSLIYVTSNAKPLQDPSDITRFIPIAIALAIYLIHTTLTELLTGRTLRKMVVGLQVLA